MSKIEDVISSSLYLEEDYFMEVDDMVEMDYQDLYNNSFSINGNLNNISKDEEDEEYYQSYYTEEEHNGVKGELKFD